MMRSLAIPMMLLAGAALGQGSDHIAPEGRATAQNAPSVAEMTPALDAAIARGMEYLAANQQEDGSFGGGRYDKLVTLLGAEDDVPAIGFSMWLDRIAARVRS